MPPPSCMGGGPGRDDCGPQEINCCHSKLVPGGSFYRSYDGVTYNDKSYPATVSDFRLDTYEVTVGRFRAFVDAGMGTQQKPPAPGAGAHPKIPNSGWDGGWNGQLPADTAGLKSGLKCPNATWTDNPGNNEKLPANCITWYDALAFCAWDGGRLPSEAEENYAAAGGSEQRAYPWSNPPSSTTIDSSYTVYDCQGNGNPGDCVLADILAVGSKPKGNGKWGQADLGGSTWDWVLDYSGSYPMPCGDCANLNVASSRVVRGGAWSNDASLLRTAFRNYIDPLVYNGTIGTRCARQPL
ncbi:MAG: SUMF1/EgtB/PvdO family nonheme iron enzyme [Deltaproteobacteria bacterium]|nr:SUMF1/EgtB/PvdO family nonheme iron enzyme [Deltaproteobacteria bacterium]